jgi:pyruvate,orthophosphate dikinase
MTKWVYRFGDGTAEGRAEMKDLLGGKGAGLAEMSNLGLPVPPGFTITTGVCTHFYAHGKSYPAELPEQVAEGLAAIERLLGARFGDADNPLLVSARARVSTPRDGHRAQPRPTTGPSRAGTRRATSASPDSHRRFIQMYGQVVLGIESHFEELLENHKLDTGVTLDTDLSAED